MLDWSVERIIDILEVSTMLLGGFHVTECTRYRNA